MMAFPVDCGGCHRFTLQAIPIHSVGTSVYDVLRFRDYQVAAPLKQLRDGKWQIVQPTGFRDYQVAAPLKLKERKAVIYDGDVSATIKSRPH